MEKKQPKRRKLPARRTPKKIPVRMCDQKDWLAVAHSYMSENDKNFFRHGGETEGALWRNFTAMMIVENVQSLCTNRLLQMLDENGRLGGEILQKIPPRSRAELSDYLTSERRHILDLIDTLETEDDKRRNGITFSPFRNEAYVPKKPLPFGDEEEIAFITGEDADATEEGKEDEEAEEDEDEEL